MCQALLIEIDATGDRAGPRELDEAALPEGNVTVQIEYSTVNYQDGLAITDRSPIVSKFPLGVGIDFAGTVPASKHPQWKPGDRVVLNGWGVGESHPGGMAQWARVNGDWLVAVPAPLSTRQRHRLYCQQFAPWRRSRRLPPGAPRSRAGPTDSNRRPTPESH